MGDLPSTHCGLDRAPALRNEGSTRERNQTSLYIKHLLTDKLVFNWLCGVHCLFEYLFLYSPHHIVVPVYQHVQSYFYMHLLSE